MWNKKFVIGDDNDEEKDDAVVDPEMSLIDVDGRRNLLAESATFNCPY